MKSPEQPLNTCIITLASSHPKGTPHDEAIACCKLLCLEGLTRNLSKRTESLALLQPLPKNSFPKWLAPTTNWASHTALPTCFSPTVLVYHTTDECWLIYDFYPLLSVSPLRRESSSGPRSLDCLVHWGNWRILHTVGTQYKSLQNEVTNR